MDEQTLEKFSIPIAIVIAGIIVGGAILYEGSGGSIGGSRTSANDNAEDTPSAEMLTPVTDNEHIRGNIDAPITIVEFSDFECPYCKRHHPTMKQVIEEFPEDVRWVYRHLPLTTIHPQAFPAAVASECVADLAGNDAFWTFADGLFDNQSALGRDLYVRLAGDLGINEEDFVSCLSDESVVEAVQEDLDNAIASGGRGTPYSIVISENGDVFPVSGAVPFEQMVSAIEAAMEN